MEWKIRISHICLLERLKTEWKQPSERIYKKWIWKEWTNIQKVCVYKTRERLRMLGHEECNCPLMIITDEGELPHINSWPHHSMCQINICSSKNSILHCTTLHIRTWCMVRDCTCLFKTCIRAVVTTERTSGTTASENISLIRRWFRR